ncbi:MAG: hypothetical protein ACR2KX_01820 [Chitinophagaceae bacterium]
MIFNAQLLDFGYIRKIRIEINDQEVFLEKDDEGNYRAVINDLRTEDKIDKTLIKTTVESLEACQSKIY